MMALDISDISPTALMRRFALSFALAVALSGCLSPAPVNPAPVYGLRVGILGASFERGYNQDDGHIADHPEVSWPSGEWPWSFAARLESGNVTNVARGGATAAQFAEQADELPPVDLAIVSFGANDICGEPAGQHLAAGPYQGTTAAAFESLLRAGVKNLVAQGTKVFLLSIPDLRAAWENAPMGTSTDPAAQAPFFTAIKVACLRGQDLDAKVAQYNVIIERIATETASWTDGGAVHDLQLTPEMISTVDGLHPNVKGTQAIADAVWAAYERAVGEEEPALANLADPLGLATVRAIEIRLAAERERGLR